MMVLLLTDACLKRIASYLNDGLMQCDWPPLECTLKFRQFYLHRQDLEQNIRRYKGVRSIPELKGITPITIDGIFSDWDDIEVEYRDTVGDTFHRDYKGYGGLHYANDSGRNDIITCKVAMGEENVSFFVETKEPLTPRTDPNWMLLLIDADQNHDTGWYGYDFLINKKTGRLCLTFFTLVCSNENISVFKILNN